MGISVTLVLTVLSFLGRYGFWAEICTHFVNLYAVAGAVGALLVLPARQWGWMAVCVAVLVVNGARVAVLYVPAAHAVEDTARLTIVSANVLSMNERYDDVVAYFRGTGADVLFIQETTEVWLNRLQAGLPEYEHVLAETREDNFGIAVLSKIPLVDAEIVRLGGEEIPAIAGAVEVSGTRVRFVNLHTMPPGNAFGLELRNRQMTEAAAIISDRPDPGFVIGDLNCGPWSPYFRQVLRDHGLRDARRGHGVLATWPSSTSPFMIPIDQCLATADIRVTRFERGPHIGSDHLPLRIELDIPAS